MRTEPADVFSDRMRRPLVWLAAASLLAVPLIVFTLFTNLSTFDDEGTLLVGFRSFLDGRRMYDEVYSLYGPFYNLVYEVIYGVLRVPLTHSNGRLIALGMWLVYGGGFAFLVYRLTRSVGAMALAYVALTILLRDLAHSPGHPEELSLVLMAGALLCCAALDRKPSAVPMVLLGMSIAGLALIKINFGVYVGGGIVFALLLATPPSRWRTVAMSLLFGLLLALPLAVESLLIAFDWVRYALVCSTMTIALAAAMAVSTPPAARMTLRLWAVLAGSAALAGATIVAITLAEGTSAFAVLNSVLLKNVAFIRNWYIPSPFGLKGVAACVASVALCLGYRLRPESAAMIRARSTLLLLARIAFVAAALLLIFAPFRMLVFVLPFGWLALANDGRARLTIARTALCLVAATMSLYPFPVAGHQMNIAVLPTLLLAVVVAHDLRAGRRTAWVRSGPLRVAGGAALAGVLLVLTIGAANDYRVAEPLGLPGTRFIRVPADRRADLRWAYDRMRACGTAYSLPGQFSFALWDKRSLPTDLNVNDQLGFLNRRQQSGIVSTLSQARDLCVLYDPKLARFFDRGQMRTDPPLLHFIQREMVPVAWHGDAVLLRSRRP